MTDKKQSDKETHQKWHSDPNNWKLGLFYFNPDDKRIFPPKKIPTLGWTINFANPLSVMAFVLLLAVVIYITRLIRNS